MEKFHSGLYKLLVTMTCTRLTHRGLKVRNSNKKKAVRCFLWNLYTCKSDFRASGLPGALLGGVPTAQVTFEPFCTRTRSCNLFLEDKRQTWSTGRQDPQNPNGMRTGTQFVFPLQPTCTNRRVLAPKSSAGLFWEFCISLFNLFIRARFGETKLAPSIRVFI